MPTSKSPQSSLNPLLQDLQAKDVMSLLTMPAELAGHILLHLDTLSDLQSLSRTCYHLHAICSLAPAYTLITLAIGTLRHERAGYRCGLSDEKTVLLLLNSCYVGQIQEWIEKDQENYQGYTEIRRQGAMAELGFLAGTFAKNVKFRDIVQVVRPVMGLEPIVAKNAGG
jgi:hypothetical protein